MKIKKKVFEIALYIKVKETTLNQLKISYKKFFLKKSFSGWVPSGRYRNRNTCQKKKIQQIIKEDTLINNKTDKNIFF